MSGWSKDETIEFIVIYRSHPCIWNIKHKDYHNKIKRDKAHAELLTCVKKFEPSATKDTILKKINNLRCVFRREFNKVKRSQKMGRDRIYAPKLWYYGELLFLVDQEESPDESSNLELSDQEDQTTEDDAAEEVNSQTNHKPIQKSSVLVNSQPDTESWPLLKRAKNLLHCDQLQIGKRQDDYKEEDQYDVFGRHIAQKLKAIDFEQRIFAQKLINDALFEAELGSLYRNASINVGYPPNSALPPSSSNNSNQFYPSTSTTQKLPQVVEDYENQSKTYT